MNRLISLTIGCFLMLLLTNANGCKSKDSNNTSTEPVVVAEPATPAPTTASPEVPTVAIPTGTTAVKLKTKFGDMVILLYNETPGHRDNFLKLVGEKFYDGLLFHRCIPNFMIQGGDPNSKGAGLNQMLGSGGPGYTIPAEFNPNFIHKRGALCAARQGDQVNPKKESSGSQFYIVQGQKWTDMQLSQIETNIGLMMPGFKYSEAQKNIYKTAGGTAQLDMNYTVFGEVIDGFAIIDSVLAQPTQRDRPLNDVIMNMEIICKGK